MDELRWIHEADRDFIAKVEYDVRKGKAGRRFSANRNYHRDGSVRYFEWYISELTNDAGKVESILCLGQDVSDRKQLEQAMRTMNLSLEQRVAEQDGEIHELDSLLLQQSRLAAMGEMLNHIAHQWRQPLNVLGLHLQQIPFFQKGNDSGREMIEKSVEEGMKLIHHMSRTIDDFRNFFRPNKERILFNVSDAIEQTVNLLGDSFKYDNIDLQVRIQDDLHINGYPNEFSQSLLNILQNARDALLEKKIAEGFIHIAAGNTGGTTYISIRDNGGGIPEHHMGRIFEPYFSTKGGQGTGIGLYMTKAIIEGSMGGEVAVCNHADGAEFFLTFPCTGDTSSD